MNIGEVYTGTNDQKVFLFCEAKTFGKFTKPELRELSDAMILHGVRLGDMHKAMRNYISDPFGKYYTPMKRE